jgi:hypothetical protein
MGDDSLSRAYYSSDFESHRFPGLGAHAFSLAQTENSMAQNTIHSFNTDRGNGGQKHWKLILTCPGIN